MREAFETEAKKTGKERLLITMAVPASLEYAAKGFAIDTLDKHLDFFNLLTYDGRTMNYVSNVSDAGPRELKPGLYGVSNHLLDTPWPKVKLAKSGLQRVIRSDRPDVGEMLAFMHDTGIAPDHQLPETGVSRELERALSAKGLSSLAPTD